MSDIRSDPYTLKDPNDNDAFAVLKDDVRLLKQQLLLGTPAVPSSSGLTNAINALTSRATTDEAAITALQATAPGVLADIKIGTQSGTVLVPATITPLGSFSGAIGSLSGLNSSTGVFTAPTAGLYAFSASVQYDVTTGISFPTFSLYYIVNGGASFFGLAQNRDAVTSAASTTWQQWLLACDMRMLSAGDTVVMYTEVGFCTSPLATVQFYNIVRVR